MSKLTFKDRLLNFYRTRPLTVFSALVVLAGAGAILGVMLLVSIFSAQTGGEESVNRDATRQEMRTAGLYRPDDVGSAP